MSVMMKPSRLRRSEQSQFLPKQTSNCSKKNYTIRIVREAQARVEFLEKQLDEKRESQQDERDGGDKKLVEELQKKLDEVSNNRDELECKLKLADEREKKIVEELQKKIDELTCKLAAYEGQHKKKDVIRNKETGLDDAALEENNSLNELDKVKNVDEFVDNFPDEIDTLADNLLEDIGDKSNEDNMSPAEDETVATEDTSNNQSMKKKVEGNEDPSSLVMEKGRKSTRKDTRSVSYKDSMDESNDDEEESNVRKTRLDSDGKKKKKNKSPNKKSSNELEKDENMDEFVDTMSLVEDEDMAKDHTSNDQSMKEIVEGNEDPSSNIVIEKGTKSARRVTRLVKYNDSMDYSDEEEEPNVKKTRLDSGKQSGKATSQVKCVLCDAYPQTLCSYTKHLGHNHKEKPTLNANGIYLICACGYKVRSTRSSCNHIKECSGSEFTLHKLEDEVHSTPQCILCEAYPKSPNGYAQHLTRSHKEKPTLQTNGIYLLCACGFEIRSEHSSRNHMKKKCHGRQYTLHHVDDE